MIEKLIEKQSIWEHLQKTNKPIFLYGMGDGADKIIAALDRLQIPLSGVYASDEFVRGHFFHGFKVQRFRDIKAAHSDFIGLLAFAINYEPMLSYLYQMNMECEFYAPDVPVIKTDDTLFDLKYIKNNEDKFNKVYTALADDESKKVFTDLLNYKVSGKIDYLKNITSDRGLVWNQLLCPNSDEIYVDLGAYTGDTVQEFFTATNGNYGKIIALEPDKKNFAKLETSISSLKNAAAFPMGAWNDRQTLYLKGGRGGRNSQLSEENDNPKKCISIEVDSVDHLLHGTPATLIKMDVEGAEKQALTGCQHTICQYCPKLMISAYHKNQDIFSLPLQVLSYNPNYKVYLRHHPYIPAWETNYYFLPVG